MNVALIHRFTAVSTHYLDASLRGDQLGILWQRILPGAPPYTYLTSLALVDLPQKQCVSILTYDGRGPRTETAWSALLRYDSSHHRWVIGLLQGFSFLALRTVTMETDQRLILSPLCLLDANESYDEGFYPLLELDMLGPQYRLLYHKPSQEEHRTAAIVMKQDLACQPGWEALEDHAVVVRSSDDGKSVPELDSWQEWQSAIKGQGISEEERPTLIDQLLSRVRRSFKGQGASEAERQAHQGGTILLPTHAALDGTWYNAHPTPEIVLVDQAELAESEMAWTLADEQTRLLILCCPEAWVWPNDQTRSAEEIAQTGEGWRIWLTGWDGAALTHRWSYALDIGLPADPDVPAYEAPPKPPVEVAAIAGPRTRDNQPTFVAVMAMQDKEQLLSHGVCLTHSGQVVQVCRAPLGRSPCLCRCQQTVIGVDRLETGWRLWNWAVLDEPVLHLTSVLDAACQRAFVRAQSGADRFWLIEEWSAGVRISLRDAQTLAELAPAQMIVDTHLVGEQTDRPLEPERTMGLLPYRETLLALVLNGQGGLELYQVGE
jgi:hypothetical protein